MVTEVPAGVLIRGKFTPKIDRSVNLVPRSFTRLSICENPLRAIWDSCTLLMMGSWNFPSSLRTLVLIVSAHPYCARKFTCHVMHQARALIGQMAIVIALLGFDDLERSVTPIFLFRNRFYLQLSPHCPKMKKKSMWEVKKISRFLSMGHGILPSCGSKAHETMVAK